MVQKERIAIFSIALIMAFRMLSMFMILPIFSIAAIHLPGATPTLIGFALGIYGLAQACLQLPLGRLSDKIGRITVITGGLVLLAIGSLIAALSHSIYGIIIGRAIQGTGAVGSTLLALAADLSRDEHRSKAMATLGLTIGLSFALALILGPAISHYLGLQGIFWTAFGFSIIALIMLHTIVPHPPSLTLSKDTGFKSIQLDNVLKNMELNRLHFGIFSLHAILTATFIATPVLLSQQLALSSAKQALLYFLIIVTSFLLMLPFIIIGEKKRQLKRVFIGAITTIAISQISLQYIHNSTLSTALSLLLFFTAFTLLEAILPSLVSKTAPIKAKGTAMGLYSSAQFLGIFIGGSVGGLLFSHGHINGVFIFCSAIAAVWLIITARMQPPPYFTTCLFPLKSTPAAGIEQIEQRLIQHPGITEVAYLDQSVLYVKADLQQVSKKTIERLLTE